jgi:anti-anti-sigma factor
MKLDVHDENDRLFIKIGGQLLYSEADHFKEEILPKIGQHSLVTVDCQDLEFIDSAGTGAIVRLWKECRMVGAELELIKVVPEVQKLLHLTRLHQLAKVRGLDDAA